MKRFWHKIELLVDKLIVLCLVILMVIIVVEFFFEEFAHNYHALIMLGDSIVVAVFVADLIFKYIRLRNVPLFIRRYWLDILAVFPFYLFFRVIEFVLAAMPVSEALKGVQMVLHEGLEIEKEGAKVVKEAGKSSRFHRFIRLLRPVLRLPRFLKVAVYFEKPTGNHHHHEKNKA